MDAFFEARQWWLGGVKLLSSYQKYAVACFFSRRSIYIFRMIVYQHIFYICDVSGCLSQEAVGRGTKKYDMPSSEFDNWAIN